MTPLHITVDLRRNPWTDLQDKAITRPARLVRLGLVSAGADWGDPAQVAMLVETEDKALVLAETTLKLYIQAARVFGATASGILLAEEMGW